MTRDELRQAANTLPYEPGVYLMKNAEGTVIYVGKAKKLKNRVSQYFQDTSSHNAKTRRMVSQVDHFETIAAATEFEALVLECSLIKRYRPKYNILLKDDKGYPYLRVDLRESFPKMTLAARLGDDGARYFGPFGSRGSTQRIIDTIIRAFSLSSCSRQFPRDIGKDRPCLNYQLGYCAGWCRGTPEQAEYHARMEQAVMLLDGKHKPLVDSLREQMEQAADSLEFERAAKLRDRLRAVQALSQRQLVTASASDTDVLGWAMTEAKACLAVLHYRDGNLSDKEYRILPVPDDSDEAFASLVRQYYLDRRSVPRHVLLPLRSEDTALMEQSLSERFGKRVYFRVPQRGAARRLLELAQKNAREEAQRVTNAEERRSGTLRLLASMLGLSEPPKRMEAFDISNIAGTDIVASMVVFCEGKPKKSDYKRFKLENMDDQDDYGAMRQVVCRRFCHYLDGDAGFAEAPDLLLIDGGSVHAEAVREALEAMGLHFPIFGMVKDDRHRTRALTTPQGHEIDIQAKPAVFALIGRIQEETHRFAITYHRTLRSRRVTGSKLDAIEGVGEKRRLLLLKHYGSLRAIGEASVESLTHLLPRPTAQAVYDYFHPKEDDDASDHR